MITDILVAVAIAGVIAFLLYLVSNSARSAQKGNAPVVESAPSKKEREQKKQEQEEKKEVAAAPRPVAAATATTTSSSSSNNNKTEKKVASPVTSSPKSSSPATSNTSSPKSATNNSNSKKSKKTKQQLDAEEEAEMDAFVAQEIKRSGNQGIRKEKFEIVNLEDLQKSKEKKAARQVKQAEGAHFSDQQVASEKAAGFRVVGAQEAAKKEAREQNKARSPVVEVDEDGNPIKKRREPMTREEELDAALRSVLSKRGNNKKGGNGGFGGGSGGFGGERRQKDDGDKTADGKGVVDIKGEVTAPKPGGYWGNKKE